MFSSASVIARSRLIPHAKTANASLVDRAKSQVGASVEQSGLRRGRIRGGPGGNIPVGDDEQTKRAPLIDKFQADRREVVVDT